MNCTRCGCPAEIHRHYRDGDDCGRCGRAVCPIYRRPSQVGDLLWLARAMLALWRTRR